MKLIKINENELKNIKQKNVSIYYAGCYGDPCEYGYEAVYVYYIKNKQKLYQLDTHYNINYILNYYFRENGRSITFKLVPQEWYKLGVI